MRKLAIVVVVASLLAIGCADDTQKYIDLGFCSDMATLLVRRERGEIMEKRFHELSEAHINQCQRCQAVEAFQEELREVCLARIRFEIALESRQEEEITEARERLNRANAALESIKSRELAPWQKRTLERIEKNKPTGER
ncbi:MAG: hypothetical protein WBD63_03870 [Phycisphaerae bacterium]|nr:hypothetical protein [Phycisphaerae bacterium]